MAFGELFEEISQNELIIQNDNNDGSNQNQNDGQDNQDNKDDKLKDKQRKGLDKNPILDSLEIEGDNQQGLNEPLNNNNSNNDNNIDNVALGWAKQFEEYGLIDPLKPEDKIESIEDVIQRIHQDSEKKIAQGIEEFKNSLNPKLKTLAGASELNEQEFDKVLSIKREQIKLDNIAESEIKTNKELQKQIYKNFLQRTTKFSDEKIEKHVTRLEEMEELAEESVSAFGELKNLLAEEEESLKNNAKERQAKEVTKIQERQERLNTLIKDIKEVIPGVGITTGEKKDLENYIFKPVAKDQNGNPIFYFEKIFKENPEEMTVKLNYLALITNGFKDWSKIEKKAVKEASKKIDNQIFNPGMPKNSGSNLDTSNSGGDVLNYLRLNNKQG